VQAKAKREKKKTYKRMTHSIVNIRERKRRKKRREIGQ
jgi:hypothetical protein